MTTKLPIIPAASDFLQRYHSQLAITLATIGNITSFHQPLGISFQA